MKKYGKYGDWVEIPMVGGRWDGRIKVTPRKIICDYLATIISDGQEIMAEWSKEEYKKHHHLLLTVYRFDPEEEVYRLVHERKK